MDVIKSYWSDKTEKYFCIKTNQPTNQLSRSVWYRSKMHNEQKSIDHCNTGKSYRPIHFSGEVNPHWAPVNLWNNTVACLYLPPDRILHKVFLFSEGLGKGRSGTDRDSCPIRLCCALLVITLFTNPSARAGYDTRSIFKWSLTGLNSEFSFS